MFGFIVTELDELHCLYKYRGVGVDRKEGEGKFPESTGNLAGIWMGMEKGWRVLAMTRKSVCVGVRGEFIWCQTKVTWSLYLWFQLFLRFCKKKSVRTKT
jgi:hypothetical protein